MPFLGLTGPAMYAAIAVATVLVLALLAWIWYLIRPQVFQIFSNSDSKYQFTTPDEAYAFAQKEGLTVASKDQLQAAFNAGASVCKWGWLSGSYAGYPQQYGNNPDVCGSKGLHVDSMNSSGSQPFGVWVYGNKWSAYRKYGKTVVLPWNDFAFKNGNKSQAYRPYF